VLKQVSAPGESAQQAALLLQDAVADSSHRVVFAGDSAVIATGTSAEGLALLPG
jgi:hypothetical protein